jgi:hypothetical protein
VPRLDMACSLKGKKEIKKHPAKRKEHVSLVEKRKIYGA